MNQAGFYFSKALHALEHVQKPNCYYEPLLAVHDSKVCLIDGSIDWLAG